MENMQLPQGLVPQGQAAGGEDESKRKAAEDDMRRDMMATVLDTGARERCPSPSRCFCLMLVLNSVYHRQCPASRL